MKRNTITLVALLAVLLVIAYLVMQRSGERSTSGAGALLVHIDSVAVDRLEIQSPKSRLVLEKRGVDWYMKEPIDYRADQTAVANLIHDAKTLEIKSVVSNKPGKFPVFQVDTISGTRFTVYEKGSKAAELIIGKVGGAYTDLYVRKLSSDDVNAVDPPISYQMNRAAKDWRDKTIITTAKESIKEIKYQYGDTTFTLAYKDSVWVVGNNTVKTEDVNGVLSTLSNFQADDFIDSTISPAPKISALISYAGNQLRFSYLKPQNKYAVQSSNSPQWFVVENWKTNSILKRKKDFVKTGK
ncbi:MAG TPA: DUF4340 domain-containing protein [Bacteroidota bacterium]